MSAAGFRALRDLSGLGLHDLQEALHLAQTLYEGDLLIGVGHRLLVGAALHRHGTPQQVAARLKAHATAWAHDRRRLLAWQQAMALFAP